MPDPLSIQTLRNRQPSMRAQTWGDDIRDALYGLGQAVGQNPLMQLRDAVLGKEDPGAVKLGMMPVGPGGFQLQGLMDDVLAGRAAGPSLEVAGGSGLNASGESAASLEALNRLASEKAAGMQRVRMGPGGKTTPLIGPDAVDIVPRAGEAIGYLKDGLFQLLQAGAGWKG